MPTEPNLELHDVRIREAPLFSPAGGVQRTTILEFFVGPHGPFLRQLASAEATPERLRSLMDTQQAELRRLLAPGL